MTDSGEEREITKTVPRRIVLGDSLLRLEIDLDLDLCPRIVAFGPPGSSTGALPIPLLDVVVSGLGRSWSGGRYIESALGERLRYVGHDVVADGAWRRLVVGLRDPQTGLRAEMTYRLLVGAGVLSAVALLANDSAEKMVIESVTSLVLPGIEGATGDLADVQMQLADNTWLAEGRWRTTALRDLLPDLNRAAHEHDARGWFGLTGTGSWSSGAHLPMGACVSRDGFAVVWEVESSGPWHWQVGEYSARSPVDAGRGVARTSAYVAVLGPTRREHDWVLRLEPGERFESVPATVAVSSAGFSGAVASLTSYRRAARRSHGDHVRLPVVFNDYMNTLMGDPTADRLLPLVEAAASVGAECFCIDAGWFAGRDEQWWQGVGRWAPSPDRFPRGIGEVLDRIRSLGLVPGLWLEPEVVGVDSPVAGELPSDAFFSRDGIRVVEQGRYLLDFRHPAVREHLDGVVDRLVRELGVGYLKLDYNVDAGAGTDAGGLHAGAGLLAHSRAYLRWLDAVLDRYPDLTLESCASGGLRLDPALVRRCQLHSTSDQQDFLRYPPIASAALAAVPFEQAANWAYPQPGWSDDETAFTLVTGLVGRLYLSGHLDKMDDHQLSLVAEAVRVHRSVRADLATSVPFWPDGLPRWSSPWTSVGLAGSRIAVLAVWRRTDAGGAGDDTLKLHLPSGVEDLGPPAVLFPSRSPTELDWDPTTRRIEIRLPRAPSACLVGFGAPGYASLLGGGS